MIKNKIVFYIIISIAHFLGIILVGIPSHIYGISLFLMAPIAFALRLFIDKPNITIIPVIAVKIRVIFVLLIIPVILYLYVWEPAGWIFFGWMGFYLLIGFYSGEHQRRLAWTQKWKNRDDIIQQNKGYHIKYNLFFTILTIILNGMTLFLSYQLIGGTKGLLIGVGISIVIWLISPFVRTIVVNKHKDKTTKIE